MTEKMHFIFDFDGILGDTEFEVSKITHALAAERGVEPLNVLDVHAQFSGYPTAYKFNGIAEAAGTAFSEQALEELHVQHEAKKAALYEKAIPLVSGIIPVLESLQSQGHVLSVATSNPTPIARSAVEKAGLSKYFNDRVFGCDTKEQKKPAPHCYEQAIAANQNLNGPMLNIGIEDSVSGMHAAAKACAYTIGLIDNRFGAADMAAQKIADMKAAGASIVIRDYDAFRGAIPVRRYGFNHGKSARPT